MTKFLQDLLFKGALTVDGAVTLSTAAGTGTRMVVANAAGVLSTQTITSGVSGTGTTNYLARWTGSTALGNSAVYDNGSIVAIGTSSPNTQARLTLMASPTVSKSIVLDSTWDYQTSFAMKNGNYSTEFNLGGTTKSAGEGGPGSLQVSTYNASTFTYRYPITFFANANVAFAGNSGSVPTDNGSTLQVNGSVYASSLTGSGTRMVVANASGVLSTQAIPTLSLTDTLDTVTTRGNTTSNTISVGGVTLTGNGNITTTNQMYISATNYTNSIVAGWDAGAVYLGYSMGALPIHIGANGTGEVRLRNTGGFKIDSFAGTGTRMLVTDSTGVIGYQDVPPTISINNNGGYRVITGSATANTLNAQSTLVYYDNIGALYIEGNASFGYGGGLEFVNTSVNGTQWGFYAGSTSDTGFMLYRYQPVQVELAYWNTDRYTVRNDVKIGWSSTAISFNAMDTALAREAAGLVQINNGSLNTYASLKLLSITATSLAGVGTRMVTVDSTGLLGSQAIPSGGGGSGTVTSVAALTIGTSGTDITSTVANSTTTPVITLNVPDASVTARGVVTTSTQSFTGLKTFRGTTASDAITLGSELTTTGSGTNWTGTGFATGYAHTAGSTVVLTTSLAAVSGNYYKIVVTITGRTAGFVQLDFGGYSNFVSASFTASTRTTSISALTLTPTTDFNGTVVVSIKSVISSSAVQTFQNSSGTNILEYRGTTDSIYYGVNAGKNISSAAINNIVLGNNSGVGITDGVDIIAIGNAAATITADASYLIAIGTYALQNTRGGSNIAIGRSALQSGGISASNISIGNFSSAASSNVFYNVTIGQSAGYNNSGSSNIIIGYDGLYNKTTGDGNTVVGYQAGKYFSSGFSGNTSMSNSILLGYDVRPLASAQTNQIVIGYGTIGQGSNTTSIGNSSTTLTYLYGAVQQTSVTSSLIKADSTGKLVAAAAGTDYLTSVSVSNISATGTPSSTTYLRGDGTWSTISGGAGGTVTSVSIVSANGFAGTVATATATPAITISTTVTGLLKGNGTSISAAVAGTDYLASYTEIYQGTVTSVAALTLGTTGTDLSSSVATGTTTPVITLNVPTASASNRGALSSTDWSTFNNKQATITLTTTGNSGAATFSANTLNVPTYTLAGLGGQASSTNLTSLSGLTFASTSFVKMTAAGTFALDTDTYYLASNPSGYTNNTGTVTTVSVTTANGVSGTVATAGTTPAITLSLGAITPTSVNSVVISGSTTPTLAVTGTSSISGSNTGDNAVNTLYSGLVSNATHTGDATGSTALTVVGLRGVALPALGASAGFLRYTGTGTNTWVFDTSTYLTANQTITLSGAVTGSGTTAITTTLANSVVGVANLSATGTPSATTYLRGDNTWATITAGGGSVTTVSVVSANGFAGTVATATSTPAITLSTTITGLLKGNGTAISAATANTDYLAVNNPVYTGTLGTGTLTYTPPNLFQYAQQSQNSYIQAVFQNSNSQPQASADIVLNNNLSTDTTYYGDLGINSSNFNGTGSLTLANAVYLTATTGDLAIGTTTSNAIHFVIAGGATDAATIKTTSQLQLPAYTTTTSFTGTVAGYLAFDSSGNVITTAAPTGGSAYTVTSQTANYTVTATSGTTIVKGDTSGGAFTITLPTAVGNTATLIIKKTAGSAGLVIDGAGTETIDGGLTATLNEVYESITLISDNANWQIV